MWRAGGPPPAERLIAELAERQHGRVARWQLLALGVGAGAIDLRVARGRLHVVHDGTYAVGHRAASQRGTQMAAVLACGPGALLSRPSAAALHGMGDWDGRPHVTAPRSRERQSGIDVHTSRNLGPLDATEIDGVPVTTWARTIVDLADVLSVDRIVRLLEQAAILRLYDDRQLLETVARLPGRRGARRLREAIARGAHLMPQQTRSRLEERFLSVIRAADPPIQGMHTNVWIAGAGEVDALWPVQRIAVELDSARFHSHVGALERDRAKTGDLERLGYRVVRVTWADIAGRPAAVRRRLRRLLAGGGPQ